MDERGASGSSSIAAAAAAASRAGPVARRRRRRRAAGSRGRGLRAPPGNTALAHRGGEAGAGAPSPPARANGRLEGPLLRSRVPASVRGVHPFSWPPQAGLHRRVSSRRQPDLSVWTVQPRTDIALRACQRSGCFGVTADPQGRTNTRIGPHGRDRRRGIAGLVSALLIAASVRARHQCSNGQATPGGKMRQIPRRRRTRRLRVRRSSPCAACSGIANPSRPPARGSTSAWTFARRGTGACHSGSAWDGGAPARPSSPTVDRLGGRRRRATRARGARQGFFREFLQAFRGRSSPCSTSAYIRAAERSLSQA